MERVEKVQKSSNRLVEILSSRKAKYIVGTILLSGIGIALPRIFHLLAGAEAGQIFLPMHIAVLIASLVFGKRSGTIVTGSSIIFSYLLTGMPSLVRLPYMLIELVIYTFILNLFNKKYNSYISLILAIVLGRILYSIILYVSINLFGLSTYGISVIDSIITGLPGIAIQLACVPFISNTIKRGIHLDD